MEKMCSLGLWFLSTISQNKWNIFYKGKFKTVKIGADWKKDGN